MEKLLKWWAVSLGFIVFVSIASDIMKVIDVSNANIYSTICLIITSVWLTLSFILIICIIAQTYYMKNKIKKLTNEQRIEFIEELNRNPKKLFFVNFKWDNYQSLGLYYLANNEIDRAREYFDMVKDIKRAVYAIYPLFVIALYDNNQDDINKYYKALQGMKRKEFKVQRNTAKRIMMMVENKQFDSEIYESTSYPIVKEICLRYKE